MTIEQRRTKQLRAAALVTDEPDALVALLQRVPTAHDAHEVGEALRAHLTPTAPVSEVCA